MATTAPVAAAALEGKLEHKLVVLGGGGVGKSALTIRFVTDSFLDEYDPTIEDSYRKNALIDHELALLDILDTAGQEEFSSMQDEWMRNGHGFMLVYSVTSKPTFDEIRVLRDKILRTHDTTSVPMVIVGNKCDLVDERVVDTKDGQALADAWGCAFYETSAKTCLNNSEVFHALVREIRKADKRADELRDKRKGKKKSTCTIL